MKKNNGLYLCACLLLCGTVSSAASLQENFNRLVRTKQCPGCDLQGAVLTRMDLRGANLQGANLAKAKLSLTDLSEADLKNANLREAVLGGADFAGADLRGADLSDAKLAGAYFNEAVLDQEIPREKPYQPEEPEQIESSVDAKNSSVSSEQIQAAKKMLREAAESDNRAALPDIGEKAATTLYSKKLLSLSDARLTKSKPEREVAAVSEPVAPQPKMNEGSAETEQQVNTYTVETVAQSRARVQRFIKRLQKERRCIACDLAGADLRGKNLKEVDLERADLSGAQLGKADLRAANLKGVNFTDANLKNADLRKADLYLADFTHADLSGARLEGALTDSSDFTGALGVQHEAAHE